MFDHEESHVYEQENDRWRIYPHPECDSRGIIKGRTAILNCHKPPPHVVPLGASPRQRYNYAMPNILSRPPENRPPETWHDFCESLPRWEADLLRFQRDILPSEGIISVLNKPDQTLHIVSDGGYKHNCGSSFNRKRKLVHPGATTLTLNPIPIPIPSSIQIMPPTMTVETTFLRLLII